MRISLTVLELKGSGYQGMDGGGRTREKVNGSCASAGRSHFQRKIKKKGFSNTEKMTNNVLYKSIKSIF